MLGDSLLASTFKAAVMDVLLYDSNDPYNNCDAYEALFFCWNSSKSSWPSETPRADRRYSFTCLSLSTRDSPRAECPSYSADSGPWRVSVPSPAPRAARARESWAYSLTSSRRRAFVLKNPRYCCTSPRRASVRPARTTSRCSSAAYAAASSTCDWYRASVLSK